LVAGSRLGRNALIMNYLAHLYLGQGSAQSLIGSLMGDFIRGHLDESLPLAIRQGIWLHRKIDAFTDAHPVFRASKGRLRPPLRRYAGILVDVFYDHFLARDWALYSSVSLRDFSWSVYRTLHSHHERLPTPMNRNGAVLEALFLVTLQEIGNPARPGEGQRRPQNVD